MLPSRQPVVRTAITTLAVIASVIATVTSAAAQNPLEIMTRKGEDLANRFCATCHVTPQSNPNQSNASGAPGVPTMRHLANIDGQTGTRIKSILIQPHHSMPDMSLTNDEITALVAYLDSLRTDRTTPLLTPPPEPGYKPPNPKRS